MEDLWRKDRGGCLAWCAFMFGCPGLAFLSIIVENTTGFHLRNVEWFQSSMDLVVFGALIAGGGYLLIKLLGSQGSSDRQSGQDDDNTLDRGAGTMSWDDWGESGSE